METDPTDTLDIRHTEEENALSERDKTLLLPNWTRCFLKNRPTGRLQVVQWLESHT